MRIQGLVLIFVTCFNLVSSVFQTRKTWLVDLSKRPLESRACWSSCWKTIDIILSLFVTWFPSRLLLDKISALLKRHFLCSFFLLYRRFAPNHAALHMSSKRLDLSRNIYLWIWIVCQAVLRSLKLFVFLRFSSRRIWEPCVDSRFDSAHWSWLAWAWDWCRNRESGIANGTVTYCDSLCFQLLLELLVFLFYVFLFF